MLFNTTLSLDALRCWQPNEDADEPFLWTFFFAIDGSTVRQHSANSKLLLPSVIVQTGGAATETFPILAAMPMMVSSTLSKPFPRRWVATSVR